MFRAISLILVASLLNGCVALVPLIEPDRQARGDLHTLAAAPAVSSVTTQPQYVRASTRVDSSTKRLNRYIRIMEGGEPVERAHAAYWLGEMGRAASPAVPVLTANLRHENHWVRRASAKALGKIGSPDTVAPLKSALNDRNRFVAHSAANALKKIGTKSAKAALVGYHGI